MLSLGLSSADLRKFQQSLITGYQLKVTVNVLDLNHKYVSDVSGSLIDGQVNKSFYDYVSSNATLTLMDPDGILGFDTQSPSDGALYADRMLRIQYSVFSELLPKWVDVPIFTGPVTGVSRDDAILSVECQGKESLYMPPSMSWATKTYTKGWRLVDAVRSLLENFGGETKFDLPEWGTTLGKNWTLMTETNLWWLVQQMSGTRAKRLTFYDGRGVLRMKAMSSTPHYTFTENHMTSVPKLAYDMERIRNTVLVKGGPGEGRPQIIAIRHLPVNDPSSAQSLSRNGKVRPLVEVVDDSNLITQASANAVAQETLDWLKIGNYDFDFDSVPVPHLEPGDTMALSTRDMSINLRVDKFSIPLKPEDGSAQSNGTHRRISSNRARIRRR